MVPPKKTLCILVYKFAVRLELCPQASNFQVGCSFLVRSEMSAIPTSGRLPYYLFRLKRRIEYGELPKLIYVLYNSADQTVEQLLLL